MVMSMVFGADDNRVYLVPIVDVNWLVFAPFDPGRDFRIDPPDPDQALIDLVNLMPILRDLTDGKYVLTPHSGTYCRDAFYEGALASLYRDACAGGADVAIHLHEEIKGAGTRFGERDHMSAMMDHCGELLARAGINPVAYRGGHYAYAPFMNDLLERTGILVDYSCAPGMNYPDREAIWAQAPLTATMLPKNPTAPWAGQKTANVLEIPIGSDGLGSAYGNILHVEQSDLENLLRIWDVLVKRAEDSGAPQIVHCLFHTASVQDKAWLDRYQRFLAEVSARKGQFVTSVEARGLYERFAEAETAS